MAEKGEGDQRAVACKQRQRNDHSQGRTSEQRSASLRADLTTETENRIKQLAWFWGQWGQNKTMPIPTIKKED